MFAELFEPLDVGALELPTRIVMAPMTRGRSGGADGRTPVPLMAEYYAQRAAAGLIVSEATAIGPMGYGWLHSPGIYADAHVDGWRRVTDAVHDAGGRMLLQLWHQGRTSHPDFLDGRQPVGPSAVAADGKAHTAKGAKPYVTPHALTVDEIAATVRDYADAAGRARDAGFDGVEVHGANGYLIDQFLRDGSNRRDDRYGGSVDNRCRFLLEVVEAVCDAWEPGRVGVRLSPTGTYNGMSDSDPKTLFTHAAVELGRRNVAYVHTVEPIDDDHPFANGDVPRVTPAIRDAYAGRLIGNGGYTGDSAAKAIREGRVDAVAFGTTFLANPDLPARLQAGADLNPPDPDTFYTHEPQGYTDYPTLTPA